MSQLEYSTQKRIVQTFESDSLLIPPTWGEQGMPVIHEQITKMTQWAGKVNLCYQKIITMSHMFLVSY